MSDHARSVVCLVVLLPACTTVMYDGPRRPDHEVATIVATGTRVTRIDARDAGQMGAEFLVLSGTHIVAAYLSDQSRSSDLPQAVCFQAETRHRYRALPRYTYGQRWELHIVDDVFLRPVAVRPVPFWSHDCATTEAVPPSLRGPRTVALTPPRLLADTEDSGGDPSGEPAGTAVPTLAASAPLLSPPVIAPTSRAASGATAATEPEQPPRRLSGLALGFWTGVSVMGQGAGNGAGVGRSHWGGRLNLDVVLWSHIPLGFAFSRIGFDDQEPFTEVVMECTTHYGVVLGCGDPKTQSSDIIATLLSVETGYQHRFRPLHWLSLLPAALAGYTWNPGGLKREIVGCDDCRTISVSGVPLGGPYVSPSFKVAFNSWWAVGVRSEIYWTGNLAYRTLLGAEIGKF